MKEQEISTTEKAIWWAKVGGIVAALIGIVRHTADLASGGIVVTAGALGLESILYTHKQQTKTT